MVVGPAMQCSERGRDQSHLGIHSQALGHRWQYGSGDRDGGGGGGGGAGGGAGAGAGAGGGGRHVTDFIGGLQRRHDSESAWLRFNDAHSDCFPLICYHANLAAAAPIIPVS